MVSPEESNHHSQLEGCCTIHCMIDADVAQDMRTRFEVNARHHRQTDGGFQFLIKLSIVC